MYPDAPQLARGTDGHERQHTDTNLGSGYNTPEPTADRTSIGVDYALVIRTANPFAPRRSVLQFGGIYGYGTWAGARFAASEVFLDNKVIASGRPFECLLVTDVLRGYPQAMQVLAARLLV